VLAERRRKRGRNKLGLPYNILGMMMIMIMNTNEAGFGAG
jgi:hypothetical protein